MGILVYIGVLIYDIALWFISQRTQNKKWIKLLLVTLFIVPFILLCSLKATSVGLDTPSYKGWFEEALTVKFNSSEPLFGYYNYALRYMKIPYVLYLLISYSICFVPIAVYAYKRFEKPLTFLFFIFYLGLFGFAMSGMRQSMAIGIAMIGFCAFNEKKIWTVVFPIVSIAIAYFIHNSTPVMALFIVTPFLKMGQKTSLYSMLVILIFGTLSIPLYCLIFNYAIKDLEFLPKISNTVYSLVIFLFLLFFCFFIRTKTFKDIDSRYFSRYDSTKAVKVFNLNPNKEETKADFGPLINLEISVFLLFFGACNQVIARLIYDSLAFSSESVLKSFKCLKSKTSLTLANVGLILFVSLYFVIAVLVRDPIQIANYKFA